MPCPSHSNYENKEAARSHRTYPSIPSLTSPRPPLPPPNTKQAPADWSALEDAFLDRVNPEDSWELTPDALRFLGRVFDEWAVAESVEEGDGDGRRVLGPEEVGHE